MCYIKPSPPGFSEKQISTVSCENTTQLQFPIKTFFHLRLFLFIETIIAPQLHCSRCLVGTDRYRSREALHPVSLDPADFVDPDLEASLLSVHPPNPSVLRFVL